MPVTYNSIATTTLSSTASSIAFSSISSAYTDLKVVLLGTTGIAADWNLNYNGDTATNYAMNYITGDGSSLSSSRTTNVGLINLTRPLSTSTTIPMLYQIDIFNYTGSTFKTCLFTQSSDRAGSGVVTHGTGLWRSTSAITTVTLNCPTSTFSIGTTATLYGILKA
jgi:hypothetical protein